MQQERLKEAVYKVIQKEPNLTAKEISKRIKLIWRPDKSSIRFELHRLVKEGRISMDTSNKRKPKITVI